MMKPARMHGDSHYLIRLFYAVGYSHCFNTFNASIGIHMPEGYVQRFANFECTNDTCAD